MQYIDLPSCQHTCDHVCEGYFIEKGEFATQRQHIVNTDLKLHIDFCTVDVKTELLDPRQSRENHAVARPGGPGTCCSLCGGGAQNGGMRGNSQLGSLIQSAFGSLKSCTQTDVSAICHLIENVFCAICAKFTLCAGLHVSRSRVPISVIAV